jgi:hypothetical protein
VYSTTLPIAEPIAATPPAMTSEVIAVTTAIL